MSASAARGVYYGPPRTSLVVHLTDTQYLVRYHPQLVPLLISALVARGPAVVVFTGDGTDSGSTTEMAVFKSLYDALGTAGITVAYVPGNHDYPDQQLPTPPPRTRVNNINAYLTAQGWLTPKDAGKIENTYGLAYVGERQFLFLNLEYSPRNATLTWAQGVLASNPNTPAIVLTHAYLYSDATRYDWPLYGLAQNANPNDPVYQFTPAEGINDGQAIWNTLINNSPNTRFVFCGHVSDLHGAFSHLRSTTANGKNCDQFLGNTQEIYPGGGMWWMEYLFDYANKELRVSTYSPYSLDVLNRPTTCFYVTDL